MDAPGRNGLFMEPPQLKIKKTQANKRQRTERTDLFMRHTPVHVAFRSFVSLESLKNTRGQFGLVAV
jgi:hypothetical protein